MRILPAFLLLLGCAAPTESRVVHRQALTVDTAITPIVVRDEPRERIIPCEFVADTVAVNWGGIEGYEIVERCY